MIDRRTTYRDAGVDTDQAEKALSGLLEHIRGTFRLRPVPIAERGMPSVKGIYGVVLKKLNAEHGLIQLENPSVPLEVGDKIELWVHYSDATINLHEHFYGIRNGEMEEILRIEG